jgi:hypothetical protein
MPHLYYPVLAGQNGLFHCGAKMKKAARTSSLFLVVDKKAGSFYFKSG